MARSCGNDNFSNVVKCALSCTALSKGCWKETALAAQRPKSFTKENYVII